MRFKYVQFFMVGLVAVGMTSCSNRSFEDPSAGVAAEDDQKIKNYLNANSLQNQVTSTASGLYYILSTPAANAKKATPGDELEFRYKMSYIDVNKAVLVDSSNNSRSVYLPFISGVVIPGLEEGLLLMSENQKGQFFIPSPLAFGTQGSTDNKIRPNTPVIFDLTLLRSRTQTQQIEEYLTSKNLKASDSAGTSGVVKIVKTNPNSGSGAALSNGQSVTVSYKGYLLRSATPFDSSRTGDFTFTLGSANVISGFNSGIAKLRVGDEATIVFPSTEGYGTQGSVGSNGYYTIPPYSPLAFKIVVKSVK